MELFSLLAKLTLDTKEYDREVSRVQGQDLDGPEMSLGLDTDEYDTGVDNVNSKSDTMGEHVGGIFEGIKSAIEAAGITAVLASITKLISDCVNKAATMGDEIDKGSKRMGISTDNYQRWNHALGQSGGAITDLSRGMKNFRAILADDKVVTEEEQKALDELCINTAGKTREQLHDLALQALATADAQKEHAGAVEVLNSLMSDNDPAGTQAAALKELGVETRKANGELKTSEELMQDTILALADMTDTDKRDNLADVLFGPNSGGLKPLLDEGREGVKALLDEADDLGLIMSEEEIHNAVAYGDAIANLNAELDAIQTKFVETIMPNLTAIVKDVTKIVAFFNGRLNGSILDDWENWEDATDNEIAKIEETGKVAGDMVDKLFAWGDATRLTADEQAEWQKTADWLIKNVPGLSEVIDKDTMTITANKEEVHALINEWKDLAKQRALQELKEKKYKSLVEENEKAIDAKIEAGAAQSRADSRRTEAINKINALYEQMGISDRLSADATYEDVLNARGKMSGLGADSDTEADYLQALMDTGADKAIEEYETAQRTADEAKTKFEEMKSTLAEAQEKYDLWCETAEGLYSTQSEQAEKATENVKKFHKALMDLPSEVDVGIRFGSNGTRMFKQAKGDWSVPYDDYPSLLHRGEMVLTASEARRYRDGDGSGVDLSGLRGEIVDAIKEGMADATVNSYLDGRQVTDEISRRMAAEAANRRYG